MTIHWSVFVPGVLMLLYPADRLFSSRVELRSFDCFQNLANGPRFRPWWWVPALWIDPLRGFAGTWLALEALDLGAATWATVPRAEYALFLSLLVLAILCQTFTRRGDQGVLLAPLGFVAGIVVALTPWPVSILGLVTAALGLFGFRQFHAFFAFGFAAILLLGFVLRANLLWLAPAAGTFALPLVTGLVTGSSLEVPTRNDSRAVAAKTVPR